MALGDPLGPQCFSSGLGGEARIRQRRAKRRVLLRVRFGQLAPRRGRLRRMLLPAFAPTAGRLRPQAEHARAVFCQARRNGLAAPAQYRLGEPCAAATVFQRHLRLKSTPGGTRHLRCREAQVLHLTGRERRLRKWLPETHGKSCSLTRFVARLRDHLGSYHTAVLLFPEIT